MSKKNKKTVVKSLTDGSLPYWFDLAYDIKDFNELKEKAQYNNKLRIEMEDWITQGKPSFFKPTGRTA